MSATCAVVISFFLVSIVLTFFANGVPIQQTAHYKDDPEEAAGMFQGDMLLTDEQQQMLMNPIQGRNGLIAPSRRWPNRVVYFKIIGDFDAVHRDAIFDAISTLESVTCLKFREADACQPFYVAISSKPGGCYTAVGYQRKVQDMNLEIFPIGVGCFRPGTILHEFMHALGFYHEQSSSNRDQFVNIIYDNIMPGKEFNFKQYSAAVVTDFGVGYDYNSCLHYRSGAFSKNGQDTIVPLDKGASIGQRTGLSKKDIDKINVMYKCLIPM